MKLTELAGSGEGRMLARRLAEMDHRKQALFAADCAEHVLRLFEGERPGDGRPRRAIEGARAWARGEIKVGEARKLALASHAAARDAEGEAAVAAARAAGHAVATAHVPRHSNGAWMYAAKAMSAAEGGAGLAAEREWQLARLGAFEGKR